ncbi:hypothetical protein V1517DRAFT_324647 [Lipomyces orientalis]|uniref:Uncharacterized protein n=1 Tax=Lipomyces orientalis TaxID=1233043 RepID=A0ACC3TMA2_9ASCO
MTGHLKRKRSRVACEPCRGRKRKCNGGTPCSTCSNWGYDCYYEVQTRPKKHETYMPLLSSAGTLSEHRPGCSSGTPNQETQADLQGITQSLEANSGAAFVRKLGLKVDSTNAPRLNLFGWNIGARHLPSGLGNISALRIVDILSLADMKAMADVYFTKVDPCYGFIDSRTFFERLDARWRLPLVSSIYDSVLAGVAALGSLFSHRSINITELLLVESARSVLEIRDSCGTPCMDTVTGWALRVVYMRMTASPHSTWIASSTLMHLIEALGLHLEPSDETVLSCSVQCDPDVRRRLVGVAQHLNMWTSYDLGLSRVSFQNGQPLPPSPKPGDYTTELLNLLPISASLGPERTQDDRDLESSLVRILDGVHTQPPSVLAQCNLVLCLLRRLLVVNRNTSSAVMENVLALFKKALHSARSMIMSCCPWQHVANVPFHIISILLEMDSRASLDVLPDAMQTLKLVASTYDTGTMREAYSTACLLVLLYQRRRCEDAKLLSGIVNTHYHQTELSLPIRQTSPTSERFSWLEGLVADIPSLQGADLYQSLGEDMIGLSRGSDLLESMNLM